MPEVLLLPDEADRSTRALGAPLASTIVRVLDQFLRPVAEGRTGELYVAGPQLARGYLGEPRATAVRFVADPSGPPGARMYRTGDVVRWSRGGGLVFVRRADDQLKIRGFRVDLAEIELDVQSVPGVVGATGIVVDGVPHVVATTTSGGPDGAEIRDRLRAEVPPHRVPASVVVVDRLPLTVRGKVDRRRLAELVADHTDGTGSPAEVTDPRLGTVVDVFGAVLGSAVGPDTDFFSAGGHSLLALRLVARVNTELGTDLTVRDLFGAGTPRGLLARPGAAGAQQDGTEPSRVEGATSVEPLVVDGSRDLTRAQAALWYVERTLGGGTLYSAAVVLGLTGQIDGEALQAAVHDVVARHPALRSTFPEVDGRPVRQELHPQDPIVLEASTVAVVDCPPNEAADVARRAALRAVDLTTEPPWGVTLVRSGISAVLVLRTHHIVCDGWAAQVLAADLGAAYEARCRGAVIQGGTVRRRLAGGMADPRSETFWTEALRGAPHQIALPTDRPRPEQATLVGFSRHFGLEGDLADDLAALVAQHGATPFAVVHAAFVVVLHRLGAGQDVIVGTPVAGRDADDVDVVDMFVNTLALRSDVSPTDTFESVVARSRRTVRDALAHQDVPFERVVELVRPPRSSASHPIFQVLLSLDDTPRRPVRMGDLDVERLTGGSEQARFDLSVYLEARGASPVGVQAYDVRVECSSDLFDPPAADLVWNALAAVLRDAASHPDRRVGDLVLFGPAATEVLDGHEHGALLPVDADGTVHGLFRAAAAIHPTATAVVDVDGEVGYDALRRWSDDVAHRLGLTGVRPGDRVAVAVPRSADMVAAMLGTMTAGAAYVPLDLSYPDERLEFLVGDSEPSAILVPEGWTKDVLDRVLRDTNVPVIGVPHRDDVETCPAPRDVSTLASAYLIYTSGTTGRPKGVVVSHAAAVNQLRWMQEEFPTSPGEKVLQKTPTGFDVSVTEIFWPLSVGATLVQAGADLHHDPRHLRAVMQEHEVGTAFFVPSMLAEYLVAEPEPPRGLRQLIVTGEPVRANLVEATHRQAGAVFHNGYGPTEVAVHATSWSAAPGAVVPVRVPIGVPLRNVSAYVLDQRLHKVPSGVTGELYLAGIQLADGYHRRPGTTAERFVADPFGGPGARMYRTGDVVRRGHDGLIEYVGRTDSQVKVRGVRVELGEIERVLLEQEGVHEAVVVLQPEPDGAPRLVAHVVTAAVAAADIDVVRQAESSRVRDAVIRFLPSALVPDRVAVHQRLVRLPNGKVDRSVLPAVTFGGAAARRAPEGELERLVHAAVARVVGHEDFGADDRFFDVGGDSIRSIAVAAAVRAQGYELDLRSFFDPGTIASLATSAVPIPASSTPDVGEPSSATHRGSAPGPEIDDDWDLDDLLTLTDEERDAVSRGTDRGGRA